MNYRLKHFDIERFSRKVGTKRGQPRRRRILAPSEQCLQEASKRVAQEGEQETSPSTDVSAKRRRVWIETVRVLSTSSAPLLLLLILGMAVFSGCTEGFEPFNEVDKFRILSVKADPPDLTEGETTTLSALIHTEDDKSVTYRWSWCPIAANNNDEGGCAVDEETLKDLVEEMAAEQVGDEVAAMIEDFPLSFDLGTEPTARFIYALPRDMLSDLCDQLIKEGIPNFSGIPQCKTRFNVVVQLEVTKGKKTLRATKQIPLYVDESRAGNRNPEILDVAVTDGGGKVVTDALVRGRWYDLKADIPKETVDTLLPVPSLETPDPEPRKETLFMTWYVTGGSTDFLRTTYIEDEVTMKVLRNNRWRIPHEADFEGNRIALYLVLQDEQGGADWLVREFDIEEE